MVDKFEVTERIESLPWHADLKETSVNDPMWDLLREGDNHAFERIFKANYSMLLNYGLKLNQNQEEVQDCIQSLFLTIWERRTHLGPSTSVRNYLMASLRRMLLKRIKNRQTLIDLDSESLDFYIELSTEMSMIQDQTLIENVHTIQSAIHDLPPRQREALYLKFYKDQSFAEVAVVMNISTRAVYKLIYKALDYVSSRLDRPATSKNTLRGNLTFLHIPGLYIMQSIIYYS